MERPLVLIVEDDREMAGLIKRALEGDSEIEADVIETSQAALETVAMKAPDLIIVDPKTPLAGGAEAWPALRSSVEGHQIPIVVLTSGDSSEERTVALELGADDCVTKPFSVRELRARVRAILRRGAGRTIGAAAIYRSSGLFVDFDAMAVVAGGRNVRLTRRELALLRHLIAHKNRLVPRHRILEEIWGYESAVQSRSVDVHVGRLRTKLGDAGRQIQTVIGLGYRFVDV
jgi:two-component system, OmpR family, phosphate regulon response regulator PhoB